MGNKNTADNMRYRDVIVIGAGASGLMASIAAARAGASVLVLNHHSVPGKKILSTGNGKCNFTNEVQNIDCYRSDDPELVREALGQFSAGDAVSFFEGLGILAKSKNGYYYPMSEQAVSIREALLDEAEHLQVEIRNDVDITGISADRGTFRIEMRPEGFETHRCILATGGRSAPKTGSDGSGYRYATGLGHSLLPPLPALVPLVSGERWLRRTAGVRCDGSVTLFVDGQEAASDRGQLQFADGALSGIPVFQVSRYASIALDKQQKVEAVLDFFPDRTRTELTGILRDSIDRTGSYKNWYQILCGLCNQKIAAMLCEKLHLNNDPLYRVSRGSALKQAEDIAAELKNTVVLISGTGLMDHAQTTCGGIPLAEIGPDMQSKRVPGLYFAGEILNVDGICGGYNLQWAWTSGYLAGTRAAGKGPGNDKENPDHSGDRSV